MNSEDKEYAVLDAFCANKKMGHAACKSNVIPETGPDGRVGIAGEVYPLSEN